MQKNDKPETFTRKQLDQAANDGEVVGRDVERARAAAIVRRHAATFRELAASSAGAALANRATMNVDAAIAGALDEIASEIGS